jgi:hypothetical protein
LSRRDKLLGLALGVLTVVALAVGHARVGYVRDEGMYFSAARSYADWVVLLASSPAKALSPRERDRHFRPNHEHPALLKTAAGVSARLFAQPSTEGGGGAIPLLPEGAAMRLPAQMIAGLGVSLLFFVGRAWGGALAGLLAAASFVLLPRVAFNAGLCCFDVPVAVASLVVVLAYRRSLENRRWGIALGPLLGLAIAVKHNALFIGPLLFAHYLFCLAWEHWRERRRVRWTRLVPLPVVSMLVLAPLTAFVLWPWLWGHPIARISEYFAFHMGHSYYNMEYLGVNYHEPMAMPASYPFVMLWATVPTALIGLGVLGLGVSLSRDWKAQTDAGATPRWTAPLPKGRARHDGVLLTLLAVFPIALISLPSTPIFGGTKHFLTAYPFLSLAAALAWTSFWRAAKVERRWLQPAALALCVGPAAISTASGHPYNLSQYAPLVGGARGAADLGLNRGFWGHAVLPFLPQLGQRGHGPVYIHDVHPLVQEQYDREGRWPDGVKASTSRQGRARAGLIFHERHMTTDEVSLWNRLHTTRPTQVITLHDVPLTTLYVADP